MPTEITPIAGIFRDFFRFCQILATLSALFLSDVEKEKRRKKKRIKREEKRQRENKNTKWARSLCPLDVEDQKEKFKILYTTTQSETSPDGRNFLLLLLVHSDTHINS